MVGSAAARASDDSQSFVYSPYCWTAVRMPHSSTMPLTAPVFDNTTHILEQTVCKPGYFMRTLAGFVSTSSSHLKEHFLFVMSLYELSEGRDL